MSSIFRSSGSGKFNHLQALSNTKFELPRIVMWPNTFFARLRSQERRSNY
ncbi:unnamed protein product [Brassica oleracea]